MLLRTWKVGKKREATARSPHTHLEILRRLHFRGEREGGEGWGGGALNGAEEEEELYLSICGPRSRWRTHTLLCCGQSSFFEDLPATMERKTG